MSQFHLDTAAATHAISAFVGAATGIASSDQPRPTGGFESLTGIAEDVDLHLRGVSVARAALADAATTAGKGVRELMEAAESLDAALAAALDSDFAVGE